MSKYIAKKRLLIIIFLIAVITIPACNPITGAHNSRTSGSTKSYNTTGSTISKNTTISDSKSTSKVPTSAEITTSTTDYTTSTSVQTATTSETIATTNSSDIKNTDTTNAAESNNIPPSSRPVIIDNPEEEGNIFPLSWTEIYQQTRASVVLVRVTIPESSLYEERVEVFSGLIIDENGYVITSYSMLDKAVDYRGMLFDGATLEVFVQDYTKAFPATLFTFDILSDIAVLKIEPGSRKIKSMSINRSYYLDIGMPIAVVLAPDERQIEGSIIPSFITTIGLPGVREDGLPHALFTSNTPTLNMVPGAPVLDQYGRILGMCSGIKQLNYMDQNSYVIPAKYVNEIVTTLIENKHSVPSHKPKLGVAVMSDESSTFIFQRYNFPKGLMVVEVQVESPAYTAGLRSGDIIISINGEAMQSTEDLIRIIGEKAVGSHIEMNVYRPSEDYEINLNCYLTEARH